MDHAAFEAERTRVAEAHRRVASLQAGAGIIDGFAQELRTMHLSMPFEHVSAIVDKGGRTPGVLANEVTALTKVGLGMAEDFVLTWNANPQAQAADVTRQVANKFIFL